MGRRKLTLEEVKKIFAEKGYELLETEYKNNHTPMRYRCLKHPDKINSTILIAIRSGSGCPYCAGNHKYTIEEVRDKFKERGYELLEDQYKNSATPMKYRCPHHPDKNLKISFSNFIHLGRGCPYCSGVHLPRTFEEVNKIVSENGYELLETEYVNDKTLMRFRCLKHPDKVIKNTFHSFTKHDIGSGCRICKNEKISEAEKGDKSHFWKGGVTKLNYFLRKSTKRWKQDVLKSYGYKCALTKMPHRDLQVHHCESYYKIRDDVLKELGINLNTSRKDFNIEEFELVKKKIEERHKNVIGVPLRKPIHKLFHTLYGKSNNTIEQFYEFEERWNRGEFDYIKKELF